MYARRHTKKRGTLIVACPALEAFELARITEQTTKTPRRTLCKISTELIIKANHALHYACDTFMFPYFMGGNKESWRVC